MARSRSRPPRPVTTYVIVAILAACGGSACSRVATASVPTEPASTPTGRSTPAVGTDAVEGRFDIGGYSLWLSCTSGTGTTVVFEAGLGSSSGTWDSTIADLGPGIRACRYARAGIGASDRRPSRAPVGVGSMADELDRLLDAASISGPLVVVAHSYGAMIATVFTDAHRDETVGLVLIDPSSIRLFESDWVANDNPWVDGSSLVDKPTSQVQLAAVDSLDPLPLIVLTQGQIGGDFKVAWTGFHAELAGLSTNSRRMIARDSGHMIQEVEPGLVAEAVRAVLDAAATSGRLPPCDARFTDLGAECTD